MVFRILPETIVFNMFATFSGLSGVAGFSLRVCGYFFRKPFLLRFLPGLVFSLAAAKKS